MSTQAMIFREQAEGWYKGVSIQYDGDIRHVGRILDMYYQFPEETDKLIHAEKYIKTIGIKPEFKHYKTSRAWHKDRTAEGWNTYTEQWEGAEGYFVAETLADIRNFRYFAYSKSGDIRGRHYPSGMVIPYQFSGHDYLYVQDRDGRWKTSHIKDSQCPDKSDMTKFYPLESAFQSKAEQNECLIDKVSVFRDTDDYLGFMKITQAQFEHELNINEVSDITPDKDGELTDDDIIEALADDMKSGNFAPPNASLHEALHNYVEEYHVFVLNNRLYIR